MPIEKSSVRREMRQAVRAMPPSLQAETSARLACRLEHHFASAAGPATSLLIIAGFLPLPGEPDLTEWFAARAAVGHTLAFPLITGPGIMEFRQVTAEALAASASLPPPPSRSPQSSELKVGTHGVREPDPARCPIVADARIDWVLVPGLAFAPGGARLGRGAGYYDRWLAAAGPRPLAIGVAFARQILSTLPTQPHDRTVDHIVTEDGWIPGARGVPEGAR